MTCNYCGQLVPDYRTQLVGCCIPGSYRNAVERIGSLDGYYAGPNPSQHVFDYLLKYHEKGT